MIEWKKIRLVEDEEILHYLGRSRVAMSGEGYYVKQNGFELYVLTVGNGVIIQIHNCSYIYAIVKRISNGNNSEHQTESITTYAVKEVHSINDEREWLENYKSVLERDFT